MAWTACIVPTVASQFCLLHLPRMETMENRFSLNNSECVEQNQTANDKAGEKGLDLGLDDPRPSLGSLLSSCKALVKLLHLFAPPFPNLQEEANDGCHDPVTEVSLRVRWKGVLGCYQLNCSLWHNEHTADLGGFTVKKKKKSNWNLLSIYDEPDNVRHFICIITLIFITNL